MPENLPANQKVKFTLSCGNSAILDKSWTAVWKQSIGMPSVPSQGFCHVHNTYEDIVHAEKFYPKQKSE